MKSMNRRELLKGLGAAGVVFHPLAVVFGESSEVDAPGAGIFLNQVGYLPSGAKQATVRLIDQGNQRDFLVRSLADKTVVFKGKVGPASADEASGDQTSFADFSSLRAPGRYQLEIAGLTSDPIHVAPDVYGSSLRLTMRGFTGQRCGCAVDLGDGYKHPPCHAVGAFHASSGKSGPLPNQGGWHDAGDYGRYVVNSGISTGTLLWAWELYPTAVRGLSLSIPESGGKLARLSGGDSLEPGVDAADAGRGRRRPGTSRPVSAFARSSCRRMTS